MWWFSLWSWFSVHDKNEIKTGVRSIALICFACNVICRHTQFESQHPITELLAAAGLCYHSNKKCKRAEQESSLCVNKHRPIQGRSNTELCCGWQHTSGSSTRDAQIHATHKPMTRRMRTAHTCQHHHNWHTFLSSCNAETTLSHSALTPHSVGQQGGSI